MTCDLRLWTLGAVMLVVSACGVDKVIGADGGAGGRASGGAVGSGGAGGTTATGGRGGMAGAAGGRGGTSTGGRGGSIAETGGVSGQGGRGGQGGQSCSFSSTVTITESGGLVGVVRTTTLTPPSSYRVQGRQTQGTPPSCMPALPTCGAALLIDASDLELAVTHPDVQTALSTNARYGNLNVLDGSAWHVARSTGGAFDLSNFEVPCTPSATCIPAPDGVKALIQAVRNLNTQQLADPSCAGVGN